MSAERSDPEVWVAVEGHPSLEVSSHGRARRADDHKLLAATPNAVGYRVVNVPGSSGVQFALHRLVAAAFLGRIPPGARVKFRGDHSDCSPENLYLTGSVDDAVVDTPTTPAHLAPRYPSTPPSRPRYRDGPGRDPSDAGPAPTTAVRLPLRPPDPHTDDSLVELDELAALNPHLTDSDLAAVYDYYYLSPAATHHRATLDRSPSNRVLARVGDRLRWVRRSSHPHPLAVPVRD